MSQGNLQLDTSTHVLAFFPGTNSDPPYYVLTDKKRPELATPAPMQEDHQIRIQQTDNESGMLRVGLGDEDIGEFDGTDDTQATQLADFVAAWRDALALIGGSSSSSSSSGVPLSSSSPEHSRISSELQQRVKEFTSTDTITLRTITWNMHGEPLAEVGELDSLLGLPILCDMYVLCLQESDTLGPKNLYANTTTLANTKQAVLDALGGDYSVVGSNQLLGLMVLVFATEKLTDQISGVRRDTTGTGLFGVWGNKGAAAVWMNFGADAACPGTGVNLAFINCHLTAGDGKTFIDRRKWEFGEIAKKLDVMGLVRQGQGQGQGADQDAELVDKVVDELSAADLDPKRFRPLSFLMGDLNYRVTMDAEMVSDFSSKEDFETIIVQDQLGHSRKDDRILYGFTEGTINFPPSYKYVVGTDNFDNSERTPSYTDRVFYTTDDRINQVKYQSCGDYRSSDHKPVVSQFEVTLPIVDYAKRKQIVDQILKDWDQEENAHRPIVQVKPGEIAVTNAKVLQNGEAWLTVHHDQKSTSGLVHWQIFLGDGQMMITAEPKMGDLPPGASQQIRLSFCPTVATPNISQIAIVSITDAQDIFVPVEISTAKTCLGSSLDLMSRMPDGARCGKIMDQASTNMPREVWNCIDYLWTRCVVVDMFDQPGDSSLEQQIQEWLDCGEQLDATVLEAADQVHSNISVYSVATVLVNLLKYLDGGVVPLEYYNMACKGVDGVNPCLEQMPGVNVNVLIYITGFLHKCVEAGGDEKHLLDIFDRLIIAEPDNRDFLKRDKRKRREFLKSLINSN